MNWFVAIPLPGPALATVCDGSSELRQECERTFRCKWTLACDYHVTVKFLGQCPDSVVDHMVPGIAEIAARTPPLHVLPAPFGFFPDANRPRVVYAGVLATDELVHVAREIDVSTSSAGIKRDPRPYCPHITIGRMIQSAARFPRAAGGIDGASKAQLHGFTLPGPLFEPFWATSLVLMRNTSAAERVAQPARYTVVRAFELKEV